MKALLTDILDWYGRHERPISSISLVAGFVFDALTLKRVDLFWENIWVVMHILGAAIFIILIHLQENDAIDEKNYKHRHFWYVNTLQFLFGGLLSTFLVFYFRSSTFAVSWPFLFLLSVALIANDMLKKHYARSVFQISFFYLSLFAFTIFIVPVFFHRIGFDVFMISGFTSLAILGIFLVCIIFFAKEKLQESRGALTWSITGIFLAINILYFLNIIPPIPLSLKDGGIYHSLVRDPSGNYIVESEEIDWLDYFNFYNNFHLIVGEPAYAYSAIFSPTLFNTDLIHEWQKYDDITGKWIAITTINLKAVGGRDDGYRTYSVKNNLSAGRWRVEVKTTKSQIIGRLRFNILHTKSQPPLVTIIKD